MPKKINHQYRIYIKPLVEVEAIKEGINYNNAKVTYSENFSFRMSFNSLDPENMFLTLSYKFEGISYRQQISIIKKASNLGKGFYYMFLCPFEEKPCRILYFDTYRGEFCCREAYSKRLYYPIQLKGRRERFNARYWEIEKEIENLSGQGDTYKRAAYDYNGKKTKRSKRLLNLHIKQDNLQVMRLTYGMPSYLQKLIFGEDKFNI